MKNIVLIFAFLLICMTAESQEVVRNQGVKRQVESMVITKWSKRYFRPKWYYRLVHNSYRKGRDRRLVHQLAPTLAITKQVHEETQDEADEVHKNFVDELAIHTDKLVNTKYDMLYKDRFNELFAKLYSIDLNSSLQVLEGHSNVFQQTEHVLVIENFQERKKVIKDSYSPSEEKNTEYDVLIGDMEKYLSMIIKIKKKLATYNKYAPMLQTQEIED